ncbi:MAG: response regulator receiver protein [Pedosphaera sp.]|nr:response regulator receiver protein [Pedosphaera sp.]
MPYKKTVLIVDDSQDDALLLQRTLREAGILNPVELIHDGAEAIAYLQGRGIYADTRKYPPPYFLFLDLKMPEVDGFEVLHWLRTLPDPRSILVVVLSGAQTLPDVQRAYKMGAHSFLTKPFGHADIANLLKAFPKHWAAAPR